MNSVYVMCTVGLIKECRILLLKSSKELTLTIRSDNMAAWKSVRLLVERPGVGSTRYHFETWAILFTRLCPCLSEETYLVSMLGN